MNGLVILNKPTGITSAKALYRVRKITRIRKSGHAGTLDPGADGVLVLCLGKATKLVESLMDQPKVYRASARLDVTSESFDSDRPLIDVPLTQIPSGDDLADACRTQEGLIRQTPPAISAVKINGRRAYKRARAGELVEPEPRPVTVYWIYIRGYQWPVFDFEIACGRGCYVRSIIRDIGAALCVGGCLTALTRLAVGPFDLQRACTFEDLERDPGLDRSLIPLEHAAVLLAERPIAVPPRPDS